MQALMNYHYANLLLNTVLFANCITIKPIVSVMRLGLSVWKALVVNFELSHRLQTLHDDSCNNFETFFDKICFTLTRYLTVKGIIPEGLKCHVIMLPYIFFNIKSKGC